MGTEKVAAGDDKKNKMQAAVSGTEAIRTWDEHMIGPDALCERLGTHKE
jgi:hypothetical protein